MGDAHSSSSHIAGAAYEPPPIGSIGGGSGGTTMVNTGLTLSPPLVPQAFPGTLALPYQPVTPSRSASPRRPGVRDRRSRLRHTRTSSRAFTL